MDSLAPNVTPLTERNPEKKQPMAEDCFGGVWQIAHFGLAVVSGLRCIAGRTFGAFLCDDWWPPTGRSAFSRRAA